MSEALPFLPLQATQASTPIYVLRPAAWPGFAEGLSPLARGIAAAADFRAQPGRTLSTPSPEGATAAVLVGLGDGASPLSLAALGATLPPGDYHFAALPADLSPTLAAVAWALGAYRYTAYKARKAAAPQLAAPAGADMAEAERVARAVYAVRDLVNAPAGDLGPDALHQAFADLAAAHGASVEAIVGDALIAQNYPLIHAVGRAATQTPRLVRLTWGDPKHPKIALVGKGVTFDSGGLDIKPSAGMRIMKKDMGGAAHVFALGQMIMSANLPVRLDLSAAIVENAIAGNAMRPGDIIRSRKGLTVEIDNTDAEGRLILADALARACEENPHLVLDFATLTGAARTALGPDIPPLFTDDDALAGDLSAASVRVADPLWRMPLWMGYDADMDSAVADLKNTGDGAFAGAIYGALFLKRFVTAPSWAHFDVYAWSNRERGGRPLGGEAHALRAVWDMLKTRYPQR